MVTEWLQSSDSCWLLRCCKCGRICATVKPEQGNWSWLWTVRVGKKSIHGYTPNLSTEGTTLLDAQKDVEAWFDHLLRNPNKPRK